MLNLQVDWVGASLKEDLSTWWRSEATKSFRDILLINSCGIWLARNDMIFKDIIKVPSEIAIKVVGIVEHFLDLNPHGRTLIILQESINLDIPWEFFDGAVGGMPSRCGGGAVLYLTFRTMSCSKKGLGKALITLLSSVLLYF